MRIGIAGCGGIGLGLAALLAAAGHEPWLWAPRGGQALAAAQGRLLSNGVIEGDWPLRQAADAAALCDGAEWLVVAVPANGHRAVVDALLPALRRGQRVLVSSMASLSALYLHEAALARGLDVPVIGLASTVLTARRIWPGRVRVLTRRGRLGLSVLPGGAAADQALAECQALFGDVFERQPNALATVLANVNPISHGPLALFNWTRIERAESWPQYHYLTPHVAAVIERLDAERQALAAAFGLALPPLAAHFAGSFGTRSPALAGIAEELHAARGGPPGPTDVQTRFLHEDVPYGLVFNEALGRVAGVAMPATATVIEAASLVCGTDFRGGNDLLIPLGLAGSTVGALLKRLG
ncbi:MAG: NAD/NADP octopine/nopaline dehydrogenase family protein [Proteobacteria bacterium]|nr:NAD/NADP octopine/nopaline dehydrogenase family protein [Pseudomonadota bacterium]